MKKISSIVLALIAVVSLTGCGSKTITCTKTEDDTNSKIVTTFKGDEVTKVVMESTVTVEADEVDTTYSFMQMAAAMYEDTQGINVSASKTSNSVSLKIEMEPSKLDEETMETMGLESEDIKNTSSEKYIESMTEDGYTCK